MPSRKTHFRRSKKVLVEGCSVNFGLQWHIFGFYPLTITFCAFQLLWVFGATLRYLSLLKDKGGVIRVGSVDVAVIISENDTWHVIRGTGVKVHKSVKKRGFHSIDSNICNGQESWCLPCARFFFLISSWTIFLFFINICVSWKCYKVYWPTNKETTLLLELLRAANILEQRQEQIYQQVGHIICSFSFSNFPSKFTNVSYQIASLLNTQGNYIWLKQAWSKIMVDASCVSVNVDFAVGSIDVFDIVGFSNA